MSVTMSGRVTHIFVAPRRRAPMKSMPAVNAVQGRGLEGDRYCYGAGSYNASNVGSRQVSLINGLFFDDTSFTPAESRRNLVVVGVELMWLIGRTFQVGNALLCGVKYCDPCLVPRSQTKPDARFQDEFLDRGGLIARVVQGGVIRVDDAVIPPPKGY